ncbi:hypothetical protein AB4144_62570, partial [Rhizobiaceae sp. 2RAB30]
VNILQATVVMAIASGAGAAIGNLTVASFAVSTRNEPAIVIRLAGTTTPLNCRVVDTAGSETRARVLDCGEKAMPRSELHVRP